MSKTLLECLLQDEDLSAANMQAAKKEEKEEAVFDTRKIVIV
jgi:hypothetical protein